MSRLEIRLPFPLASGRYEVGPSMRRFGQAGQGMEAEEGHFWPDDGLAAALEAKLAVLRRAAGEAHLVAPTADEAGLRAALRASFGVLAAEHPAMCAVDEDGVALRHLGIRVRWAGGVERVGEGWPSLAAVALGVYEWLAGRGRLTAPAGAAGDWAALLQLGDALGLAVQEDLALVRGPMAGAGGAPGAGAPGDWATAPDGGDTLEWLHVCLPSNWAPAEKIGGSFAAVHEPVVHSERLLASQGQIIRAMIHAGPFVRYVWALHRDGELCHNPRLHQAPAWRAEDTPEELVRQAWFRVERQTTHGLPELNRGLFTIRYWVAPLESVAADPWRRERLAAALAGMDEHELAYKGLAPVRDKLVTWLQG
jgi:dimethylamine monooxygenase subunit A